MKINGDLPQMECEDKDFFLFYTKNNKSFIKKDAK